jgi:hypothetical protein
MDRRQALQVLAAIASVPGVSPGAEAMRHVTPESPELPGTKHPKFFTRDEFQLVDSLSELIIPADAHSPGAHAADVAGFADNLLLQSSEKTQHTWREGLAGVDLFARSHYSRPFLECSTKEQTALLRLISRNEASPSTPEEYFFVDLKRATVDGYYRSAIGIHQDLQYQGNKYRVAFPGCGQ